MSSSIISVEQLQSLFKKLGNVELGDRQIVSFGYGGPVLENSFKNCTEYLRIMQERQREWGDNDIMATVPEFRLSVLNTLRRIRLPLSRMMRIKYCEATDHMRANVPVQIASRPQLADRFDDVMNFVTINEKITMNQLVKICEWIPTFKNEVKTVYLRLRETLEYGSYVVDTVLQTAGTHAVAMVSGPLHTRFPIDMDKFLKDVNLGSPYSRRTPLHDFDTMGLYEARNRLSFLKYSLNYDAEHVAALVGNTEARPDYWVRDSIRTDEARSNAAHTLLTLRGN